MIVIKNKAELEGMRASGRHVARIRDAVAREIAPGVATSDLADYGHELIEKAGARNAFLGYRGFPGKLCISVNDVVVHGVPGDYRIALGDVVSIDVGLIFEGFVGDTALTVMVGVSDPRVVNLVRTTEQALMRGIGAAVAGNRLSDISNAVQRTAEGQGFTIVRDFVGHGIGRQMHEEPQIPNFGRPGRGPVLRSAMTLAIEPMVNMGTADVSVDERDGWTVRTRDGLPSAHCEHMVAVCDGEAEILTLGENA